MLDLSHKNLEVYRLSRKLLDEVYKITKSFPQAELYALTAQIRRAAISICSNIAEGASRFSKKEKKRFYEIARSSAVEIDTQFEIALMLEYCSKDEISELEKCLVSTFRMLCKMIGNLATFLQNANSETLLPKPCSSNPTRH